MQYPSWLLQNLHHRCIKVTLLWYMWFCKQLVFIVPWKQNKTISINNYSFNLGKVKINNHGLTRGSLLVPYLLLIYINDIHFVIKYDTAHYFNDDMIHKIFVHLLIIVATTKCLLEGPRLHYWYHILRALASP